MRVATIDIGTNTILLLVAEARCHTLVAVEERATITRLGQGVDRTGRLAPEAVARTLTCLEEYAERVRALGVDRIAVVGTSAMRDASGAEPIRDYVARELGVDARVIAGDEEARLTFRGALSGLDRLADETITVFDIGGGSTEIVRGTRAGEVAWARSFDVGSVRLTERYVQHDPATAAELDAVRDCAQRTFSEVATRATGGGVVVGIAGTVTTLASVALELATYDGARVHGHRFGVDAVTAVVNRLAALPLSARRAVAGLEPKRADIIVSGGLVALALLDVLAAKELVVSDRGVRWGLAEQLAFSS